ncbi:DUF4407 domain-containing protein [Polynucleobacter sp. AP-Capit-er-40B-B4]|uniref:DUF4407 domain-containing protein n=1 Tax=Polynucleobacter sp. AP-Capit-er-40B-B4 TaxID=2576927 RepID=UPI001C0E807B|nr:DUF4407 domain-containing protein [Polynucleobacter sp. AP-Capit-er-40B-B4]MBU3580455.1 DUF4407 domain-containing protein [Polynucleobacter sp. AP-Capit-er-40B-B4]
MSYSADSSRTEPIFSRTEKIFLYLAAIDTQVLSRHRKHLGPDLRQFYSEGLCVAMLVILATLSGGIFFYEFLSPGRVIDYGSDYVASSFRWLAIIVGAILSGLYVMNLQKFIIFCRNGLANKKTSGFKRYGRWAFAVIFSVLCGFMIAIPLQTTLFKSEIQIAYHYQLHQKLDAAFERISKSYQPYFHDVFQRAYENGLIASTSNSQASSQVKSVETIESLRKDRGIKVENLSMNISTLNPQTGKYELQVISTKDQAPVNELKVRKDLVSDSSKIVSSEKVKKEPSQKIVKKEVQDPSVAIKSDKTEIKSKDTTTITPLNEAKVVTTVVVETNKNKESPIIVVPANLDLLNIRGRDLACYNEAVTLNKISNLVFYKDSIWGCVKEMDDLLHGVNAQIPALEANKGDAISLVNLSVDQLNLQMQKEKLMSLLSVSPNPGIIRASTIAFEELKLFSWFLILSIIFIQTMPILMKVFGSRNAYDYLVDERMRLSLAKNSGVEYQAYEIFDAKGHPVYKTFFHEVIARRAAIRDQLFQLRQSLQQSRMEQMKSKFNDIKKRTSK